MLRQNQKLHCLTSLLRNKLLGDYILINIIKSYITIFMLEMVFNWHFDMIHLQHKMADTNELINTIPT
jgi:hypothetical protein